MKTLLIPFLFLMFHSFAQSDSTNVKNSAFSFDETCYRLWWVDNKMGGYDGFELRKNGKLKLLNSDLSIGKKWWIKGDHLFTETISMNKGKIHTHDYLIKKQTDDSLVLNYFVLGEYHTFNYEAIIHDNFTDKMLGHWDGEDESFIQIIPMMNSFEFQLLVSKNLTDNVERYFGYMDEENQVISFEIDGEDPNLEYLIIDGVPQIRLNKKVYKRTCSK